MSSIHLGSVDLNLLVVLAELARSRSTTKAAKRLGRTQSAVSHALARLRVILRDPLFVRVGPALRPTALVDRLAPELADVLARAEAIFGGTAASFSPLTLARTFVVAGTDHLDLLVLPPLLARVRVEAPRVDVVTAFLGDDVERAIQARDVDMAIGTRFRAASGIAHEIVCDQDMRVLVRKGHPAARGKLDAARYASFDHALVTPRGTAGGVIDVALDKLGLRRRVVLRLPHFVVAAFVVARSDLVVTLPRSFAEHVATLADLSILPVPVPLEPFTFSVAFDKTRADDPAHAWFRSVFLDVARSVLRAPRSRSALGSSRRAARRT